MKKESDSIIYSPSDLIRYLASPFASWLDRYYLEELGDIKPDEPTEEDKLLQRTGDEHEQSVLKGYKVNGAGLIEIPKDGEKFDAAHATTLEAIQNKAPIIYQAALRDGQFAGYADFLNLDISGKYQPWDTKLALSPKPYYPIQLCCYSEMLAATTGQGMPERIGVILGNEERIEFRRVAGLQGCIVACLQLSLGASSYKKRQAQEFFLGIHPTLPAIQARGQRRAGHKT